MLSGLAARSTSQIAQDLTMPPLPPWPSPGSSDRGGDITMGVLIGSRRGEFGTSLVLRGRDAERLGGERRGDRAGEGGTQMGSE